MTTLCHESENEKGLKIVTWNILHGGGSRVDLILHTMEQIRDVDIFVLTEFRNNSNGRKIQKWMEANGFSFQFTHPSGSKVNTILIGSKIEMEFSTFQVLGIHAHRVAVAWNRRVKIFGAYFPQKEEKAKVFDFLQEILNKEEHTLPIILTGDLNTGIHFEDELGKSFYCSENFSKLRDAGMIDAWRIRNPQVKEYSWFSSGKNGFRIDHFMVNDKFIDNTVECFYDHDPRISKISDHSLMVLKIDC